MRWCCKNLVRAENPCLGSLNGCNYSKSLIPKLIGVATGMSFRVLQLQTGIFSCAEIISTYHFWQHNLQLSIALLCQVSKTFMISEF